MIKTVIISDYTDYVAGKSNTGGCYAWYTTYKNEGDSTFSVHYGTSADFEFCSMCGDFGHSEEACHRAYYEIVDTDDVLRDVLRTLKKIDNGEDFTIEWEEE